MRGFQTNRPERATMWESRLEAIFADDVAGRNTVRNGRGSEANNECGRSVSSQGGAPVVDREQIEMRPCSRRARVEEDEEFWSRNGQQQASN
jgi:hypothetical protein